MPTLRARSVERSLCRAIRARPACRRGRAIYLRERCPLSSEAEVSDVPKMSQRALGWSPHWDRKARNWWSLERWGWALMRAAIQWS